MRERNFNPDGTPLIPTVPMGSDDPHRTVRRPGDLSPDQLACYCQRGLIPPAAPMGLPQGPDPATTQELRIIPKPDQAGNYFIPRGGNYQDVIRHLLNQHRPQARPPPPEWQQDTSPFAPRRSTRVRQPTSHPDDVYGQLDPTSRERMDLRGWGRLTGDNPSQTRQGNDLVAPEPLQEDDDEGDDFYVDENGNCISLAPANSYTGQKPLADICKDGGAPLINLLLAKAITPGFELDKSLPNAARTDVRDWHFQDILKLPKAQMEEWKNEELESFRERNVFELTDLPERSLKTVGSLT